MKVVFLRSQWRWHVGMLLLFCFQSKVSSWWMCFPAPRSPRVFHSSHRQLHSICLGGGTITGREGEFLGADVNVCVRLCIYMHVCLHLVSSFLFMSNTDYSVLTQSGSHFLLFAHKNILFWPIKEVAVKTSSSQGVGVRNRRNWLIAWERAIGLVISGQVILIKTFLSFTGPLPS